MFKENEIKTKIILGVVAAILIIAVGFLFWRWAHAPRRRIIVQKRAVVKEVARKKELPKIQKKYANPKVAIVVAGVDGRVITPALLAVASFILENIG